MSEAGSTNERGTSGAVARVNFTGAAHDEAALNKTVTRRRD
jgi:hypothetical protein